MKYKLNDELEKLAFLVLNVENETDDEGELEDDVYDVFQDDADDEEENDEDDKEYYEQWLNAIGHIRVVAEGAFNTVKLKQPSGRETCINVPRAREAICDLHSDNIVLTNIRFNQTEADDLSRALARCLASRLKRGLNDNA